jgi:hypothetical protein
MKGYRSKKLTEEEQKVHAISNFLIPDLAKVVASYLNYSHFQSVQFEAGMKNEKKDQFTIPSIDPFGIMVPALGIHMFFKDMFLFGKRLFCVKITDDNCYFRILFETQKEVKFADYHYKNAKVVDKKTHLIYLYGLFCHLLKNESFFNPVSTIRHITYNSKKSNWNCKCVENLKDFKSEILPVFYERMQKYLS